MPVELNLTDADTTDNHWLLRLLEVGRSERVLKLLEEQNACQTLANHYEKVVTDYQRRSDEIDENLYLMALQIWTDDEIALAREYAKRIEQKPFLNTK